MIGIICATDDEILHIAGEMKKAKDLVTERIGTRTVYTGSIYGKKVVLTQSNIGKAAAALTVGILAARFGVDAIVLTGTGGSLSPECVLGDVVVAESLVQHDFDVPGGERFRIPILNKAYFETDAYLSGALVRAAKNYIENEMLTELGEDTVKEFSLSSPSVHTGTVASGDVFVRTAERKDFIRENVKNALCCEMEGAAAAQAAFELGIPIAVARIISDAANEDAEFSYETFVRKASSVINAGIVRNLLKTLDFPRRFVYNEK